MYVIKFVTGNLDFGEDECFSIVWIDSPPPIDHHQGLAKRTLLSDMTQKQEIIGSGHQILPPPELSCLP